MIQIVCAKIVLNHAKYDFKTGIYLGQGCHKMDSTVPTVRRKQSTNPRQIKDQIDLISISFVLSSLCTT